MIIATPAFTCAFDGHHLDLSSPKVLLVRIKEVLESKPTAPAARAAAQIDQLPKQIQREQFTQLL